MQVTHPRMPSRKSLVQTRRGIGERSSRVGDLEKIGNELNESGMARVRYYLKISCKLKIELQCVHYVHRSSVAIEQYRQFPLLHRVISFNLVHLMQVQNTLSNNPRSRTSKLCEDAPLVPRPIVPQSPSLVPPSPTVPIVELFFSVLYMSEVKRKVSTGNVRNEATTKAKKKDSPSFHPVILVVLR